jgi:hypothetical protein
MQFLNQVKIGRLSAKKGKIYPQIRLPLELADTIGEIADVFETEQNGTRAFLIVTKQRVANNNTILQPSAKVVKLHKEIDSDKRFKALESQIQELKSLILENTKLLEHLSKNKAPESGFEPESEPRQGSAGLRPAGSQGLKGAVAP